jgi:predicted nucleic acid-binding protein
MNQVRYFDSSAIIKLVIDEPESAALRTYARTSPSTATSIVGIVEARRAADRRGGIDPRAMSFVLGGFEVVELDQEVADSAVAVAPTTLRALDAIHVASARQLGRDLEAVVTYDQRLADAARAAGLPVASPGSRERPGRGG